MLNRFLFFMLIGGFGMVLGILQWHMYRKSFPLLKSRTAALLVFLLPPLFFILPHIAAPYLPLSVAREMAWWGGLWFIFCCYSTLLLLCCGLVWAISKIWHRASSFWPVFSICFPQIGLILIGVAIFVGIWTALHPVYRELSIETEKPLARDVTIAFVSDTHLSPVLGTWYSRQLVRSLNAAKADIILFGGDIIDDNLQFVRDDGSYKPLNRLYAPLGVYAVYGNHDYFNSDPEAEAALFRPLRFLRNETVVLEDSIAITGLDDLLHHTDTIVPLARAPYFNILAVHEPSRILEGADAGYDLYLAGHTHGGQFFPNTLITPYLYELNSGARLYGNMLAVVTNGYGFWGPPVRLGAPPEIVLLHLHSNSQGTAKTGPVRHGRSE